jgi:hypothetical protein
VNVRDEDVILLTSVVVAALSPSGPFPVLILHGGQGTAKTSTAAVVRKLIDPGAPPTRGEPREVRDLMIAANNSWVVAFDNLSHLPSWLSDALCRLATGGGFATRELYTDDQEALFEAQRPVILTGIEELATRGDLLDRAVVLYLPPIPDKGRRPEAEFWAEFEGERPCLLGFFLDGVSTALRNRPTTRLEGLPRMADFALWAAAAAPSFGWTAEAFSAAYGANRGEANELTLEAAVISEPLRKLMHGRDEWTGRAMDLLAELEARADEATRKQRSWPTNPQALSNALRRIEANLRAAKVVVEFRSRTGKKRGIRISHG